MGLDPKRIVTDGYERCGPRYNAARGGDPSPELTRLLEVLPDGARTLDIGCGGGIPVTAALARHGTAVGVDISAGQIEQARRQVPEATFVHADIMDHPFEPSSFDAVVCFYALFHVPREEQAPLLRRIGRWLRPGGYLLATITNHGHPGYTEPDFFGATMYWSHFDSDWYERTLRDLGFEIIERGVLGHGYRDISGLPPERHPVIFARLGEPGVDAKGRDTV
jgi:SAM-dependent methyltransferase